MRTQLLLGGRVHSPSAPDATALAVTDGTVVWVGRDGPGCALFPNAEVVELEGAFVAPAFVDSHIHLTSLGLELTGLDLSGTRNLDEFLARIRAFAAGHHDGPLLGHGWDDARWIGSRAPTTTDLDRAVPGRSVYLTRVDCHSAVCSTPLLADAGVHPTIDTAVRGDAHHRVRAAALAALTAEQRRRARTFALNAAAAAGIVFVHECAGPDISGRIDVAELHDLDHGVEVQVLWGEPVNDAAAARALLADTGAHGLAGDLFVDGSLGSHTAWLSRPYADDPETSGRAYLEPKDVQTHLRACTEAGISAGFHVIGDTAVRVVVDALSTLADEFGGPAVARCRHRLEHVEMIDPGQADILGALGVTVVVQPAFDAAWGGGEGMYATRLGPDRAMGLNPFAALAASGVRLAFGSDAPVTALDPWAGVRAAVQHHNPVHRISPRAAFAAATRGGWRAGGVDDTTGMLVPGAPASYAIWDVRDTELVVATTASSDDTAIRRWSTDPRALMAPLPRLEPDAPLPRCMRTVHRGHVLHQDT